MYWSNPSPAVFEFSFQCQSICVEFTSWMSRALGVGSPRGEEVVERHQPWIHTGPHTDCCLSVCPSAGTWRQETFCWEKTVLFRSQVFGAPYESPSPYQMYWKNSSDSDLKWLSIFLLEKKQCPIAGFIPQIYFCFSYWFYCRYLWMSTACVHSGLQACNRPQELSGGRVSLLSQQGNRGYRPHIYRDV